MEGFFYFYHMSQLNYILYDGPTRDNLLPLTFTRPMAELRLGILTIREKWERYLQTAISTQTEAYLQKKYPLVLAVNNVWINASCLPNKELVEAVLRLKQDQVLKSKDDIIAYKSVEQNIPPHEVMHDRPAIFIKNSFDLFHLNEEALKDDFNLITYGRTSEALPACVKTTTPENIFVEPGAKLGHVILNASSGPIYIGAAAEVMDGAMVRGGLALCRGSVLKMGAKIYGATTIGPYCKVGGEVNNAVFFGFSNKGHDGFVGHSVIGEWCNLGADTNTSNLKNNYEQVRLWHYGSQNFAKTGLQFCGLIMGDHSKSGINTMFNTGTVIGVSANIYGSGFPRNFIPSYSWGGHSGFQVYLFSKAIAVARAVMLRRGKTLDKLDEDILKHIFELTTNFRSSY